MLIKEFYKIIKLTSDETGINASIKLNPHHEVYKGHFPGQPVVPGVIQLQIAKEILEEHFNKKIFMGSISQVKYLIPITPDKNPELQISIIYKNKDEIEINPITIATNVLISFEETVFTKAKIEFNLHK